MKSIKPGRGPSFMGGIASVFMGVFGLLWTVFVLYAGGGFFALFGLVFVAIAIVNAVYSFRNATGKNRFSTFDITDDGEEEDPLNARFGNMAEKAEDKERTASSGSRFCPYCGAPVEGDFEFCNKCGRKLP